MVETACARCDGTGFVAVEEGRLSAVRPCDCRRANRGDGDLLAAGLPRRFLHATIDSYRAGHDAQKAALLVARTFVDDYPAVDGGLLLWGDCGSGKTHLAVGILRQLILDQGIEAIFVDYHDLLKRIQGTYGRSSEGPSEEDILDPVLSAELLVLDDLGSRRSTPWAEEVLDRLFAARYNSRRVTILTTNLLCDDVRDAHRGMLPPGTVLLEECVGERVLSRLHEMCRFVHVIGPDHRRSR